MDYMRGAVLPSSRRVVLIAKPPIISRIVRYRRGGYLRFIGYVLVSPGLFDVVKASFTTKEDLQKVEKTVILFYLAWPPLSVASSGCSAGGNQGVPPLWEWAWPLAIWAPSASMQQYCLIYAVTLESPSRVTIVRQMQIIRVTSYRLVMRRDALVYRYTGRVPTWSWVPWSPSPSRSYPGPAATAAVTSRRTKSVPTRPTLLT